MTHTDLIARLRTLPMCCRRSMWQSRYETIRLCDSAADALTAAQERIRVLTIALEHVAEGHPKDYTDNCDIARAALGATDNT